MAGLSGAATGDKCRRTRTVNQRSTVSPLLDNAKKITSLIILMLGIALVARSLLVAGAAISVGLIAGAAFTIYGAVRFYYFRKVT